MSLHDANQFIDDRWLRMLLFAMQPGPIRIFPQTSSSKDLKNISPQNNSLDKTHSSYRDSNYKISLQHSRSSLGFVIGPTQIYPAKKTVRHAEGGLVLKRVKSWLWMPSGWVVGSGVCLPCDTSKWAPSLVINGGKQPL